MPQERAFGAAVIAVIIGIVGFFTVLTGIIVLIAQLLGASWVTNWTPSTSTFLSFLTSSSVILAFIVIVLGLIYLGVAVGLWNQHYWALVITFIVGLFYVIGEASGLVWGFWHDNYTLYSAGVLGTLVAVIVVALVLAYLTAVRDDFI